MHNGLTAQCGWQKILARPFEEPAQTIETLGEIPFNRQDRLGRRDRIAGPLSGIVLLQSPVDAGAVSFHHGLLEDARGTLARDECTEQRRLASED